MFSIVSESSSFKGPILFYYAKPHLLSHKLWLKILILKALSFETIFQALFKPGINAEIEHRSLCHHYLWSQKYNTIFSISGEKMLCCITLNYGDILIFLIFWQNNKTKYASSSTRIRLSAVLLQQQQMMKIKGPFIPLLGGNTHAFVLILKFCIFYNSFTFNIYSSQLWSWPMCSLRPGLQSATLPVETAYPDSPGAFRTSRVPSENILMLLKSENG